MFYSAPQVKGGGQRYQGYVKERREAAPEGEQQYRGNIVHQQRVGEHGQGEGAQARLPAAAEAMGYKGGQGQVEKDRKGPFPDRGSQVERAQAR